jgi:hypothetical protein
MAKTPVVTDLGTGKMYTGSPGEIINAMADEITNALSAAHLQPTGVLLVAMMHVLAQAVYSGRLALAEGDTEMGQMPSFSLLLSMLTRISMGQQMTLEEGTRLVTEFVEMTKSLGGNAIDMSQPGAQPFTTGLSGPLFLSPPDKQVH